MTADIVTGAPTMAWSRRKPAPGRIDDSDRAGQYPGHAFRGRLGKYGVVCSMSRKGNCWDNAPMESLLNSHKDGRVHGTRCRRRTEAVADALDYIEPFCSRRRGHCMPGCASPRQFLLDRIRRPHEQEVGGIMPSGRRANKRGRLLA